ncbi:MAG: DNA polymerase III subunit epsilon [Magnetococcales bacterium]|nr:DNA polymerase III subunit epsilon [Magnetococcales bacterium]
MARLIVLDTETTGFSPEEGHRILEIGCVELIDMRLRETRQWYLDPERDIPAEVIRIHGITAEMVAGKPKFPEIAREFLDFIQNDTLIIHNAAFDLKFLNAELNRSGLEPLQAERAIDTVRLARQRLGGKGSFNLDALCQRLGVDNSKREQHGALLDAQILARVYIELEGGNQFCLPLTQDDPAEKKAAPEAMPSPVMRPPRIWSVPPGDAGEHEAFLDFLQKESGQCLWRKLEHNPGRKNNPPA